jgi:hypothetical protein
MSLYKPWKHVEERLGGGGGVIVPLIFNFSIRCRRRSHSLPGCITSMQSFTGID